MAWAQAEADEFARAARYTEFAEEANLQEL